MKMQNAELKIKGPKCRAKIIGVGVGIGIGIERMGVEGPQMGVDTDTDSDPDTEEETMRRQVLNRTSLTNSIIHNF